MTKLSDTQLVILSAAAQRADLSVLPLPDSLNLKGGALTKVMDSLRNRGLIRVTGADGGPERVIITSEGMAAIGVESEDDQAPAGATEPDAAPTAAEAGVAREGPAEAAEADTAPAPAVITADARTAPGAPPRASARMRAFSAGSPPRRPAGSCSSCPKSRGETSYSRISPASVSSATWVGPDGAISSRPPGLGPVGERWCSPITEIIP
jgi:hypothetical protein